MEVHQIMTGIDYGDAVSNDAITIMGILRENGYNSNIYAKYIHPKMDRYAMQLNKYKGNRSNIIIYHFSLAGEDVTDFVIDLPDIKILRYHNITPPEFFKKYDSNLEYLCSKGLKEIKGIYKKFHLGIGVSEFNRLDLLRYGFTRTEVLPICYNFNKLNGVSGKGKIDDCINILFLGRVSPNKRFEDVIKSFYYYYKFINSNSKLYLVGNKQISAYLEELERLIRQLGLIDAVVFTGQINDQELIYYYSIADIFLSMSEHEGFSVPLLEAMQAEIPIIAYDSSAVPYTLGKSGVLIKKKNFLEIAELMHIIVEDKKLRNRIVDVQKNRLQDFSKDVVTCKLLEIIRHLETTPSSPNRGK